MRRFLARLPLEETVPLLMLSLGILAALAILLGPAIVDYFGGIVLPSSDESTGWCTSDMFASCD